MVNNRFKWASRSESDIEISSGASGTVHAKNMVRMNRMIVQVFVRSAVRLRGWIRIDGSKRRRIKLEIRIEISCSHRHSIGFA